MLIDISRNIWQSITNNHVTYLLKYIH